MVFSMLFYAYKLVSSEFYVFVNGWSRKLDTNDATYVFLCAQLSNLWRRIRFYCIYNLSFVFPSEFFEVIILSGE
jgi:hypothetical protein